MSNQQIREHLLAMLQKEHAFWSYDVTSVKVMPDESLIEQTLLHLDIDELLLLFQLFPKKMIKRVWVNKIVPLEPTYHGLNRLYAFMFFNIKHPDRFLQYHIKKRLKSITCKE